jgi:hypothetical protein
MGWANCGKDSKGRPIGYAHAATCDHAGCKAKIDRGLSYACGDMHGDTEVGCEGYFCEKHRTAYILTDGEEACICDQCAATALADPMWVMDEEEGIIVPAELA